MGIVFTEILQKCVGEGRKAKLLLLAPSAGIAVVEKI